METDPKKFESIAGLICELTRNCNIKEEYFAKSFNLSPAEVRVLQLFVFRSSLTIKELCNLLKVSPGRTTQILKSLELKKLVIRSADPSDKRNVTVSVLPKCAPFIANLHQTYNELNTRLLSKVPEEKLKEIYSSLEILTEIFRTWVDEYKV